MARFPRNILTFMILAALSSTYKCKEHVNNYLGITYRSVASHNIDNFLKAVGLGPYDEDEPFFDVLRIKGKEYIYTSKHDHHRITLRFKPNKEFHYETMFGRCASSNISIIGAMLLERQRDLNGPLVYVVRSFTAKKLTVIMKTGNVTASRFYMLDKTWPAQPAANCSTEEEIDKPSTEEETEKSTEEETERSYEREI